MPDVVAKLAWLARHEPDTVRRTRWLLQPKDLVGLWLTGSAASDPWSSKGNFTLMTDDPPALIRRWGAQGKIFFVHFRDVAGDASLFIEMFHDEGPTDMLECMRAYHETGFDGPMRPDHVPALAGESKELRVRHPRPAVRGRLHRVTPEWGSGWGRCAGGSVRSTGDSVRPSPRARRRSRDPGLLGRHPGPARVLP